MCTHTHRSDSLWTHIFRPHHVNARGWVKAAAPGGPKNNPKSNPKPYKPNHLSPVSLHHPTPGGPQPPPAAPEDRDTLKGDTGGSRLRAAPALLDPAWPPRPPHTPATPSSVPHSPTHGPGSAAAFPPAPFPAVDVAPAPAAAADPAPAPGAAPQRPGGRAGATGSDPGTARCCPVPPRFKHPPIGGSGPFGAAPGPPRRGEVAPGAPGQNGRVRGTGGGGGGWSGGASSPTPPPFSFSKGVLATNGHFLVR